MTSGSGAGADQKLTGSAKLLSNTLLVCHKAKAKWNLAIVCSPASDRSRISFNAPANRKYPKCKENNWSPAQCSPARVQQDQKYPASVTAKAEFHYRQLCANQSTVNLIPGKESAPGSEKNADCPFAIAYVVFLIKFHTKTPIILF